MRDRVSVEFDSVHFGATTQKANENSLIDACRQKDKIRHLKRTLGRIKPAEEVKRIIDENKLLIDVCECGYCDYLRELILKKPPPDLEVKTENGDTPLIVACATGNEECVKELINKGADINAQNDDDSTALMLACLHNRLKCIDLLLAEKSELTLATKVHLDEVDIQGVTALIIASTQGHGKCVQKLADAKANLNKPLQGDNSTALMHACLAKQPSSVIALLDNGADVSLVDTSGCTALHYACAYDCQRCVVALNNHNADLDKRDSDGKTPLMHAVIKNNESCVVAIILAVNAKPDAVRATLDAPNSNDDNYTALMYACYHGFSGITKRLINAGANKEVRLQKDGKTPLMLAAALGNTEIVQELINNKADLNAGDRYHRTALMHCCMHGHVGCVEALIQAKADLDIKANDGKTALMWSIMQDRHRCSEMLIHAQVMRSLDAKNTKGETALMMACEKLNVPIVKALLEKGVNPTTENDNGRSASQQLPSETALLAAADKIKVEEIRRLLERAIEEKVDGFSAMALPPSMAHSDEPTSLGDEPKRDGPTRLSGGPAKRISSHADRLNSVRKPSGLDLHATADQEAASSSEAIAPLPTESAGSTLRDNANQDAASSSSETPLPTSESAEPSIMRFTRNPNRR